jgi:hypothetical protein
MRSPNHRLNHVVAGLLVVSAGLFLVGVAAEPDEDTHIDEPASEAAEHSDDNEAAQAQDVDEPEHSELGAETGDQGEDGEERILGVDPESPLMIAAAVSGSLLLAGLVWRRPDKRLLVAVAVAAGAFAVFDAAELVHQLDEDRAGLATLAALIAALHAAAAALAIRQAIAPDAQGRLPEPSTP